MELNSHKALESQIQSTLIALDQHASKSLLEALPQGDDSFTPGKENSCYNPRLSDRGHGFNYEGKGQNLDIKSD